MLISKQNRYLSELLWIYQIRVHLCPFIAETGVRELKLFDVPQEDIIELDGVQTFTMCLAWTDELACINETTTIAPALCSVKKFNNVTEKIEWTLNFKNEVNISTLSEGLYHIICHNPKTNIHRELWKYFEYKKSFHWDCSNTPRVIKLKDGKENVTLCKWIPPAYISEKVILEKIPHLKSDYRCVSKPAGLKFNSGVLLLKESTYTHNKVFDIYCKQNLVIESLPIEGKVFDVGFRHYC